MIPQWFLWFQGVAMLVMGVALLRLRPRPPGAGFYQRYVNIGTLWALCCAATGVALLAMAIGYWAPLGPRVPNKSHNSVNRVPLGTVFHISISPAVTRHPSGETEIWNTVPNPTLPIPNSLYYEWHGQRRSAWRHPLLRLRDGNLR